MARIITGTQIGARGKAAGMVYYKGRNGETYQRKYVIPANPRTGSQMAQRILFATATQAAKFMSQIIDHSFEGVAKGLDSTNEFVKRNVAILRGLAAADFATKPAADDANVFVTTKSVSALVPNKYMISNGSLSKPRMKVVDGGANELALELGNLPATPAVSNGDEQAPAYTITLAQVIRGLFGLTETNEQLTLCVIARNADEYEYSYNGQTNLGYQIPLCAFNARRLVFDPSASLSQTIVVLNDDGTVHDDAEANIAAAVQACFNSADTDPELMAQIVDLIEAGEVTVTGDAQGGFQVAFAPASSGLDDHYIYDIDNAKGHVYAGGVIRSKLVDGSWRRSKSYMVTVGPTALNNVGLIWALANPAWFAKSEIAESSLFLNEGGSINEVGENF